MPDPWPPTYKRSFMTAISELKEELIKDKGKDESEIRIYTVVLYRKGVEELEKILRFHLQWCSNEM